MSEEFQEIQQQPRGDNETVDPIVETKKPARQDTATSWLETLARLGLGEVFVRVGTNILTVLTIGLVIWVMGLFFRDATVASQARNNQDNQPTPIPEAELATLPEIPTIYRGIPRMALIHTTIPSRPRTEISTYVVQKGDTVISIAEKFGLKPRTILNSNAFTVMADNPHNLFVGQEVIILPIDGVYWQWQKGENLNKWAEVFQVKVEEIVNYPANNLDPASLGSYDNPNIKAGTMLVIPGGYRLPNSKGDVFVGVTRSNPAIARVQGPGACESVSDGAVGIGSFIWPANKHYLSGYDWNPDAGHRGIDIAGDTGEPVYATDYGVIVYAGWNDWGYGNMVMIDHGNGWQSLYAHLNSVNVICGGSVLQGTVIGGIGSTGRSSGSHLHFELMHSQYSKVNPWLYLPPP
jgi:murein DD-endopeptidase MepM/ murein hydrolase activator NlpD